MDLTDVEMFLTIVHTKSISKTADALFLSQPTISHRLKALEKELNFPLIVRSKGFKQIELTPEGTDPVEERALGAACTWRLYWWEEYRENPDLQPVRCTAVAVFYDREGNELGRAELTDIQGGV